MARSPAFQLYVSDFRQDPKTIVMSTTEIGAYFLLLIECWDKDNSLPDDLAHLAGVARMSPSRFEKSWNARLRQCFILDVKKHVFRHKRIAQEIAKQAAQAKVKSEAGKQGAAKRWLRNSLNDTAIAQLSSAMPLPSEPNKTQDSEFGTNVALKKEKESLNTHNPDAWVWPMKPLIEAFPNMVVQTNAIGFIEAAVKPGDESAWAATIDLYRMNHNPATNSYLPEKTGNLLGVFKKQKAEIERSKNGINAGNSGGRYKKRTDTDVIAESTEYYDNYPS